MSPRLSAQPSHGTEGKAASAIQQKRCRHILNDKGWQDAVSIKSIEYVYMYMHPLVHGTVREQLMDQLMNCHALQSLMSPTQNSASLHNLAISTAEPCANFGELLHHFWSNIC